VFEHVENGIWSETVVYTDTEASIKFVVIKIRNESGKARKLSVTGYIQWILGDIHAKSLLHIVTEMAPDNNTIFAKNPYSPEFSNRVAFFDTDDADAFSADRTEFIGRNGTLRDPGAMKYSGLSGRFGAALDPCAALQTIVDLDIGQRAEIVFRMGAGKDRSDAEQIISRFKGSVAAALALEKVHNLWQRTLTRVQIETPDKALNIMANGWLLYQVISCRLWGRTGFYQSGGAFGFRDQLQDTLAALHADASLGRKQILLAASRQFKEGDVQHWWHPPLGRGVRTKCSDDFLWLPFVVLQYCTTTGDYSILDEAVSFLEGRPLNANEESYYDLPVISELKTSLYDHCKRAVQYGLRFGEHDCL
jgi:cellobiose phosphorylase